MFSCSKSVGLGSRYTQRRRDGTGGAFLSLVAAATMVKACRMLICSSIARRCWVGGALQVALQRSRPGGPTSSCLGSRRSRCYQRHALVNAKGLAIANVLDQVGPLNVLLFNCLGMLEITAKCHHWSPVRHLAGHLGRLQS